MNVSDNELLILNKLFDGKEKELNESYKPVMAPKENSARYKEIVYHLNNLERNGFIQCSGKYCLFNGRISEVYKNAAFTAPDWAKINLTPKGIEYIENIRMGKVKKIVMYFKGKMILFFDKLIDNLIEISVIFISGIIIGNIDRIIEFIKNFK